MYAENSVSVVRCKFKNYNPYMQASTHIYLFIALFVVIFICALLCLLLNVFIY